MGWNGSSVGGNSAKPKKSVKAQSKLALGKGALAGGIVVVLVVVAAYFLLPQGASKSVSELDSNAGTRSIDVVDPDIAPRVAEASVDVPKKPKKYWEEDVMPANLSEAQQRKWKHRHMPPPSYTNTSFVTRAKSKFEIFDSHVENEIANLMTLEPGMGLVGEPNYDERTVKEFLKSCETPIVITEEDDEYRAQLKRDMIQMKIELRERMEQGEDLVKILTEAREEAMRMGSIKQQLEQEMRSLIKESRTLDEAQSVVEACNKLLEEKGIAPFSNSPLTERYIRRNFGIK